MRLALKLLAHPLDLVRLRRAVRGRGRSHPGFPAMVAGVAEELAPFTRRGVDAAAVDRQWTELEGWDGEHAARLVVRGGRVRAVARRADHERVRWMGWALERLARWFRLADLDLLFYFGDHVDRDAAHAPVLCFCRRRQRVGQVLIPDFEILRGHEGLDRSVDRATRRLAWEARAPRAFWRGVTTGGRFDRPGWEAIPRARLVAASRAQPELVDARFTRFVQGAEANAALADSGWRSDEISPAESVRFRYLVDVDGNSSSWSRLRWLLRSGSLVLKQSSDFVQWYYRWLEPRRDYLPIAHDLADLAVTVAWARAHDAAARAIAQAGQRFAHERLGRAEAFLYLLAVLEGVAALYPPPAPAISSPRPLTEPRMSVGKEYLKQIHEALAAFEDAIVKRENRGMLEGQTSLQQDVDTARERLVEVVVGIVTKDRLAR